MTIPSSEQKQIIDVSPRALAIARQIDRLQQGTYVIRLEKFDDKGSQWDCAIDGLIRVKEFKTFVPMEER